MIRECLTAHQGLAAQVHLRPLPDLPRPDASAPGTNRSAMVAARSTRPNRGHGPELPGRSFLLSLRPGRSCRNRPRRPVKSSTHPPAPMPPPTSVRTHRRRHSEGPGRWDLSSRLPGSNHRRAPHSSSSRCGADLGARPEVADPPFHGVRVRPGAVHAGVMASEGADPGADRGISPDRREGRLRSRPARPGRRPRP